MSKHTPGPWILNPTTLHQAVKSIGTETVGPKRICTVGTMSGRKSIDMYNALLIAAAPELLEALNTLVQYVVDGAKGDHLEGAVRTAERAIAKATGETNAM